MERFYRGVGLLCLLAAAGSSLGCSAEMASEDDIGNVSQAFNASQCSTSTALATFSGEYTWSSPSNYGTACNAVDETTGGSGLYIGYGSQIDANQAPANQTDCQNTTIRTVFYTRSSSSNPWSLVQDESHQGVWTAGPFSSFYCDQLSTFLPPPGGGIDVRVATTVRRPSGSSFVTYPFYSQLIRKPR